MPIDHVVADGECLSSVAFRYGFHPETIWEDTANAALKEARPSGYVLLAGDVVVVPEKQFKSVSCGTAKRHQFRRNAVPETFRLQLLADGAPRAGVKYTFLLGEATAGIEGTTDADGKLEQWIPPDCEKAVLLLPDDERREISLGRMRPVTDDRGVKSRLFNLGLILSTTPSAFELDVAIRAFQRSAGLAVTGVVDDDLRAALLAAHGC